MWQQFRRRRVVRVVVTYAASSFALVQAALLLLPHFALPDWSIRAVWGVVVMGFPVTVVLSWTYDLTPRGIVRTPDELGPAPTEPPEERRLWLLLTILAIAVGFVARAIRS